MADDEQPDWLDGIAQHLAARGLIDYAPAGPGGDAFLDMMPDAPDEAVALGAYGGAPVDSKLPYDTPSLQVRTRAPLTDRRRARARARAIYDELNGLGNLTLPDGSWLVLCVANQTPASMGQDERGRLEYVVNFALELFAPSAHRPG